MEPLLTIEKLSKTFNPGAHTEVRAVQDINLEVTAGEIILIMGPSGSGKTTLLTMIGGLLSPTSGKIWFENKELQNLSQRKLTLWRRENAGFVFQSFNLLTNLSALENVVIGGFDLKDRKKRAAGLLKRLMLEDRTNARPDNLSGGERQRVAIARALINDPKIILADEPTANLDKKIGHEVMDLLCSIGCEEEKGVIIVSHDERIKDIANRVLYIEDGKLVREEIGAHNKVCKMKKRKNEE
ncbi:MAG: ABC transporter ATP-binding protein [Patescibacteria group bacterium]|nr:ABC transporter ATP-binding protein [Patescibacteria group bacterium]